MILKTNLHFHANDDPEDAIKYSFIEALDEAQKLGFQCLALTCHNKFVDSAEYKKMAEERGILFVPGIERTIEHCHVVVLNPTPAIENVKTFEELGTYKSDHPEIFIIAPHPYFRGGYSLGKKLEKYITFFDAIEHSWFYSRLINFNNKAKKIAIRFNLPFIVTSDTHDLKFLNTNYAEIEVEKKTLPSLFEAIRKNHFTNITTPRKLFREMVFYTLKHVFVGHKKRKL